jgi:hypothetical protein
MSRQWVAASGAHEVSGGNAPPLCGRGQRTRQRANLVHRKEMNRATALNPELLSLVQLLDYDYHVGVIALGRPYAACLLIVLYGCVLSQFSCSLCRFLMIHFFKSLRFSRRSGGCSRLDPVLRHRDTQEQCVYAYLADRQYPLKPQCMCDTHPISAQPPCPRFRPNDPPEGGRRLNTCS